MRHRDKETVLEALQDWRDLRKKVATEGGDNYARPVLVKFLDSGTFEVMERDIVEDEFYVLRERKILRELAQDGRDLEGAIRDAGRDNRQRPPSRDQRPPGREQRRGQQGGRPGHQGEQQKSAGAQGEKRGGGEKRGSRRGRRRGRRTGRRGPRPPREGGGPAPAPQ